LRTPLPMWCRWWPNSRRQRWRSASSSGVVDFHG
jgi:hypothetical protein